MKRAGEHNSFTRYQKYKPRLYWSQMEPIQNWYKWALRSLEALKPFHLELLFVFFWFREGTIPSGTKPKFGSNMKRSYLFFGGETNGR